MNTALINKGKPEVSFAVVANRESVVISIGVPVVFVMDGTNDGIDIQLPSSSSAAKCNTLYAGITIGEAFTGGMIAGGGGTGTAGLSANGQLTQVYGICQKAVINRTLTRSATSAVWVSIAGSSIGDALSIDTVVNALDWMSNATAMAGAWPFVLAQSIASATTAASGSAGTYAFVPTGGTAGSTNTSGNGASSDTVAYITSLAKVFLRCM